MKFFSLLLASLLLGLSACSAKADNSSAGSSENAFPGGEIPFPEIPSDITEPSERADFMLLHFWDPMDFDNPMATDSIFMEQNFVNFVQFYVFGSEVGGETATNQLLARAESNPASYDLICKLANKYLYSHDSPYYNEGAYMKYLEYQLKSKRLDEAERSRLQYLLDMANKNRPGSKAADFKFVTRNGAETSLFRNITAPYTLLVFYSSDCEDCKEIISRLSADKDVQGLVNRGTVRVIAVDGEGDREMWEKHKGELPHNWTVGYDTEGVQDKEIYVYDRTPSLYLLDRNGTVLIKEATQQQLIDYAQSH